MQPPLVNSVDLTPEEPFEWMVHLGQEIGTRRRTREWLATAVAVLLAMVEVLRAQQLAYHIHIHHCCMPKQCSACANVRIPGHTCISRPDFGLDADTRVGAWGKIQHAVEALWGGCM